MDKITFKKRYFPIALALFFIFIFSFSFTEAVSLTELQTATLTGARGTGGLIFNNDGTQLFAIDNYHGAKPNFISIYSLPTPYDLSSLSLLNNTNMTNLINNFPTNYSFCCSPNNYSGSWVMTGYITRNGENLYLVVAYNGNDDLCGTAPNLRAYGILHFTMDAWDLSTLAYADESNIAQASLSNQPGVYGSTQCVPALRGIYVNDAGSYLAVSGSWGTGATGYDNLYSWNLAVPYNVSNASGVMTVKGTNWREQPFGFNWSGQIGVSKSHFANLWVSSNDQYASVLQRNLFGGGSYGIYITDKNYQNGSLQNLGMSSNREGLTIISVFTNLYLFTQNGGTLYKYQINDLSTFVSEAVNQTQAQQTIVSQVIEPLINLFPDHSTLSIGQKTGFVFVVMLLSAIIILYAGSQLRSEGLHGFMVYIVGIILIVEFMFFIAIRYIPLGFFIGLILVALAISYLVIRGKGGN